MKFKTVVCWGWFMSNKLNLKSLLLKLHRAETGAMSIEYLVVAAFLLGAVTMASTTGIKILGNLYGYMLNVICSPII